MKFTLLKFIQEKASKTAFKIVVSASLIFWLIHQGKLDSSSLDVFISDITLITISAIFWVVSPMLLASYRWHLILRNVGVNVSLLEALSLQHLSAFFTTALPGSLGGDIVKAGIIVRKNTKHYRNFIISSVIFDRLLGMYGMFVVGTVGVVMNFNYILKNQALLIISTIMVAYVIVFTLILFIAIYYPYKIQVSDQKKSLSLITSFFYMLSTLNSKPLITLVITTISIVAQALSFLLFWYIATHFIAYINDPDLLAILFSGGMFISTIPISPGGFGTGHMAFEQLFSIINLNHGANIYNVYFISQTILNVSGFLTYLSYKSYSTRESKVNELDISIDTDNLEKSNETF